MKPGREGRLCARVSIFLCFFIPELADMGKIFWVAIMFVISSTLLATLQVPMNTLPARRTQSQFERAKLMQFKVYQTKIPSTLIPAATLPAVALFGQGNDRKGFAIYGAVTAIIFTAGYLIAYWGTKGYEPLDTEEKARERGLSCRRDAWWNVVVEKPASDRYEKAGPLILQAHMDMVCAKTMDSSHNFRTDPIELVLECVFTTQEEHKSMVGAELFDVSGLRGKRMIGLDGDGETVTYVVSACSDQVRAKKHLEFVSASGPALCFEISKVTGIVIRGVTHQECANAVKMAARIWRALSTPVIRSICAR